MRHLRFLLLAGVLLASLVSPIAAPARVGPADALFTARPHSFVRKAEGKVVGVYVPSWEPTALLDRLRPGSVTHLLYAFARVCGPSRVAGAAQHVMANAFIGRAVADTIGRVRSRSSDG